MLFSLAALNALFTISCLLMYVAISPATVGYDFDFAAKSIISASSSLLSDKAVVSFANILYFGAERDPFSMPLTYDGDTSIS